MFLLQSVMVCPKQSEGIMYAVLTTMTNLSSTIALDLATILTYIVDVSNSSLESGDYTGLIQIVWITTAVQLVPLVALLPFVPSTRVSYTPFFPFYVFYSSDGSDVIIGGRTKAHR